MTGDSGCGAWPQPLLSCTTSLSIAMFVNVLFPLSGVGAPEQPRKVTDFFFSAKLFRKKNCWKSCEAGVGPGPLPGFLLKSECKVTNLRRNFQMFLQLFLRKISPRHATPCKPTGYKHKKITKIKNPTAHTTTQCHHVHRMARTQARTSLIYTRTRKICLSKKNIVPLLTIKGEKLATDKDSRYFFAQRPYRNKTYHIKNLEQLKICRKKQKNTAPVISRCWKD